MLVRKGQKLISKDFVVVVDSLKHAFKTFHLLSQDAGMLVL